MDSPDPAEQQQAQDDLEASHDFWGMSGIFYSSSSCSTKEQNSTCKKKNSFPISLKFVDFVRRTTATKKSFEKQVNDLWNDDGDQELSWP